MIHPLKNLVLSAKNKNPDAFAELIHICKKDLYRIAKSILSNDEDVADAIQETILISYEQLSLLQYPEYFKTWLIRILINQCNGLIRAGRRYVAIENIPDNGSFDTNQANVEFMMLMDSLDERYRTVLVLYYSEGFSVKEISEILDLTESAVKARLKRGREKVKKIFDFKGVKCLIC